MTWQHFAGWNAWFHKGNSSTSTDFVGKWRQHPSELKYWRRLSCAWFGKIWIMKCVISQRKFSTSTDFEVPQLRRMLPSFSFKGGISSVKSRINNGNFFFRGGINPPFFQVSWEVIRTSPDGVVMFSNVIWMFENPFLTFFRYPGPYLSPITS